MVRDALLQERGMAFVEPWLLHKRSCLNSRLTLNFRRQLGQSRLHDLGRCQRLGQGGFHNLGQFGQRGLGHHQVAYKFPDPSLEQPQRCAVG